MSRAKTSAPFSTSGASGCEQADGQPLHERGLADPGVAHEHRVVLAPAAEDLQGALQLLAAADQGVELALPRPLREVHRVGGERIAGGRRAVLAGARRGRSVARRLRARVAADPVRDVVEDVEAGDAEARSGGRPRRSAAGRAARPGCRRRRPRSCPRSARGAPPSAARAGRRGSARAPAWSRAA